jgi:effector-binding domain-containing protein
MFSIGQFSKITGLSVKTIRLYHEKGLLHASRVDDLTGYRYFDRRGVQRARAVAFLKEMVFSLAEIKEILDGFQDEVEIIDFLERQRKEIETRLGKLDRIAASLDSLLQKEKEAAAMLAQNRYEVTEKTLPDQRVATIRWKGKYGETGKALGRVARLVGRHAAGAPFNLYHDADYKEEDADIESGFPVHEVKPGRDVSVKVLPGGRCVSLIHRGSYDSLGRSYERLFEYIQQRGYEPLTPSREIYLKGPGMILRGNPKNYLTELQVLIADAKRNS